MTTKNYSKLLLISGTILTAVSVLVVRKLKHLKDYKLNQKNIRKFTTEISSEDYKASQQESPVDTKNSNEVKDRKVEKNDEKKIIEEVIKDSVEEKTFFLELGDEDNQIKTFSDEYKSFLKNVLSELEKDPTILLEIKGSTYGLGTKGLHVAERNVHVMIGEDILKLGKKANIS